MANPGGMNRRQFLKAALAGAVTTAIGPRRITSAATMASKRERPPNILLIMSDEHQAAVTGCYANRIIRSPNLDGLARRGIAFEAAYTNSPLCVPARLSFTAGKYVSQLAAWSNNCWIADADVASLPRIMTAAGYDSLLCGKMHYDPARRYGFSEIGGNMNRHVKSGRGSRRDADDESVNIRSRDQRFAQFRTARSSGVLRHDRRVTAGTLKFLAGRKRTDKPFFLVVGYLAPHFPLIVPKTYFQPYRGKVPMPELPPGHVESQPLNYHHLRRGFGIVQTDPAGVRKGRELYYGLTQWLDNEIGKVLQALAAAGLADETVVIYTSDHGENIGEHGLWWKNCMYDQAARVPLIVSWPGRWAGGQRRTGACSLVDLVQTVAELGRAKPPPGWKGDSMCNWMDDGKAPWKDFAVSEYYGHNIASGFAMLRAGRYKYVYHTPPDRKHPAQRELYDLRANPGEFAGLAERPEQQARIQKMHAALVTELGEDPDETELRCRADYARGYNR